jgi:hypothetical protein
MGGLSHQALMTNIELYGTRVIPASAGLIGDGMGQAATPAGAARGMDALGEGGAWRRLPACWALASSRVPGA